MRVIVDTNIVFSAILNSQSRIGQILLNSGSRFHFYSAKYLQLEIQRHFDKIKKITQLPESEIIEMIEMLYSKIHFISEEIISKNALKEADKLTATIDFDDVIFVALSLHYRCKLWTGDKALIEALKKKGFKRFVTTQELFDKKHK
jgi:predicted nucleic acid-binding protein